MPSLTCYCPVPPDLSDASVLGHEKEEEWHQGKEGASLKCLGEGNPPPTYNWTR